MNRRRFISSLVALAASMEILATPGVQDPKTEVNPDWVDADYECQFLFAQDALPLRFCAEFQAATKPVNPEWGVSIFHRKT